MAVSLLFFPIVTEVWQVYVLQVLLGIVGAMQKTSEKSLLADFTDGREPRCSHWKLSFLDIDLFGSCCDAWRLYHRFVYTGYYFLY